MSKKDSYFSDELPIEEYEIIKDIWAKAGVAETIWFIGKKYVRRGSEYMEEDTDE